MTGASQAAAASPKPAKLRSPRLISPGPVSPGPVSLRWDAPALPAALAALLAPPVAVLQSKAMAPLLLLCLAAMLLPALLRAARGRAPWPGPGGAAVLAGAGLGLWGALSAIWAPEFSRALQGGLGLAALALASGAAAGLLARDAQPHRRALGLAVLAGLVLGLGAASFDNLTGNALRAAVRGLRQAPPELAFGLKPAASVMALLLPLLAGAVLPLRLRAALLLLGGAVLLALPGDTAKLAALAGLGVVGLAGLGTLLGRGPGEGWRAIGVGITGREPAAGAPVLANTVLANTVPANSARANAGPATPGPTTVVRASRGLAGSGRGLAPMLLGAALGLAMLGVPALLGPAIAALGPAIERLPPSAVHRVVIWDFALQRAAERPLLGWGLEASRALPGGKAQPGAAQLDRLSVTRPDLRAWFTQPHLEMLPLHPHNGPLQVRLELGWIGSILGAAALLLLGLACGRLAAPAAGMGALASAFVTFFASFGAWQGWWLCSAALAAILAAGLLPPARSPPAAEGKLPG